MNGDIERLKRACHYGAKIVTPLWVDEYFLAGEYSIAV
jgi:hypothetical protein